MPNICQNKDHIELKLYFNSRHLFFYVYRMITFHRLCNVLKVNPSGKKQQRLWCQTYAKTKTKSNSNSISILGIPITYFSLQNGKCNICTFHEEIHAFEDWIFVRLSSLVLASEWTINRKKFAVLSIDL